MQKMHTYIALSPLGVIDEGYRYLDTGPAKEAIE
jgi:hypothetical protein